MNISRNSAALFLVGVLFLIAGAQDKNKPSKSVVGPPGPAAARPIPLVRVRPTMSDFPAMGSRTRANTRVALPPGTLTSDTRSKMLRDSGIDVRPQSAPDEFRLSPRQPYASSSAYLFFQGDTEFNASSDSLLLNISTPPPGPRIGIPGLPDGWTSAGPQPDPPAFVGVLVRMDARSRYLVDFSVSSGVANIYNMTATGADGSGSFSKDSGGQHVLVGLDSTDAGYVRINFSARSSFTFHNVVVTKLD